jgi:hypothetical protein
LILHRVDLRVLEYNKRAIRCFEKCGFVIEGRIREDALIEDKWETDIMMSILDYEYEKLKKQEQNQLFVDWSGGRVKLSWHESQQLPERNLITSVHGFCFHDKKVMRL